MSRNDEKRRVASGERNTVDDGDVDKQHAEKRQVSRCVGALPEDSPTQAWQRQKESTTTVPAHGDGRQRFVELDQTAENTACGNGTDETKANWIRRCDLPAGPKCGQSTDQNRSGQDDKNDESDERVLSRADARLLKTLQRLDRRQRKLAVKTHKLFKVEKKQFRREKLQRQPPQSGCQYGGQKPTALDRPAVADRQHGPCRLQSPSSTSLADYSKAEESNSGQLRVIDRPTVAADRLQRPCRCRSSMSSFSMTSSNDDSDEQQPQSLRVIGRPTVAAEKQQRPRRFQYPSSTSLANYSKAEDSIDKQRPCRCQHRSSTSLADYSEAEDSSSEQLAAFDRPTVAEDRLQRPCRFQYPSPTSSTDCTYAESNSNKQLLQPYSTKGGLTMDELRRKRVPNVLPKSLTPPLSACQYNGYDYWTPDETFTFTIWTWNCFAKMLLLSKPFTVDNETSTNAHRKQTAV